MAIGISTPRPTAFSIGRTLGDSIKIFGRNIVAFALAALAIRLLLLLTPRGQMVAVMTESAQINWLSAVVSMLISVIVVSATKAIAVFPTMQALRGQKVAVSDLWRSLPILPAIIVAGAIINIPSFVSLIIQGLFPGNTTVIALSGFLVGIVALVLLLMWWLYAPTIAIERGGVLQGLKRSRYLLSGQRWRVFGLMVIVSVATSAIVIATALLGGMRFNQLSLLASTSPVSPIGMAIFILGALIGVFDGVLVTVAYYYLRAEKDGPIAEDLVQVFD